MFLLFFIESDQIKRLLGASQLRYKLCENMLSVRSDISFQVATTLSKICSDTTNSLKEEAVCHDLDMI